MSTTEDRAEAQVYELGYLILPSIAEDSLPDAVNAIKAVLKKADATELDSEDPLKFDLAYTMHKTIGARKYVVDDAYIGWVKFESAPEKIKEIHDAVEKLEEVLRFLIVKTTRETHFTFAEARRKFEEREKALAEAAQAAEAPAEASAEKVIE